MDTIWTTLCLVFPITIIWAFLFLVRRSKSQSGRLPPGPSRLPIIGNLHQFGRHPHRSLSKLAKTYGPLMFLKAGSVNIAVASTPEMAKQVLKKYDLAFSGRFVSAAMEAQDHDKYSVGILSVGKEWNKIRKIFKEHLFSAHQMGASQGLRKAKLQELRDHLTECAVNGRTVNINEIAFTTTVNLMSTMLISEDLCQLGTNSIEELWEAARGVIQILTIPNLADYFPILKLTDFQGIRHRGEVSMARLLGIFQRGIEQRLLAMSTSSRRKHDMLEALLDLRDGKECNLNDIEIKHLFVDLLVGGTDTTSNIVEWTMTELLTNSNKMSIAKQELRNVIGVGNQVEESDISKLPYFQAVIKESFRLHPPGPLLMPHKADADTEIDGFVVPKDTLLLTNVWGIGRDSKVWPNPESFEPERFLDGKIDYRGRDFELLSFGAGRRICPGLPLADRMVHLIIAYLIHNFDWKLEPGMTPESINMMEATGIGMQKKIPLKAIPILPN